MAKIKKLMCLIFFNIKYLSEWMKMTTFAVGLLYESWYRLFWRFLTANVKIKVFKTF